MARVRADDGVEISYHCTGNGALAVIFMHGWAGSGEYFDSMIEQMDLDGLRAVTIDLRGHGDSDKPTYGYNDERFAQDVVAVANAAGAPSFVIVGFSMSGRFAQYVTVLAPERVVGQVLVAGCPASPLPLPDDMLKDWVSRVGNSEKLQQVTAMFISRNPAPEILNRVGQQAAKASRIALEGTLNILRSADFSGRIKSVSTPTLVVGGVHDVLFTPQALRENVVKPLARARLVLVDSNHEIPIEQPRELANLLESFIAGLG